MEDGKTADYGFKSTPMTAEEIASFRYLEEMSDEEVARYSGEWIAIYGNRVVAHGKDPTEVLAEAHRAGVESPLVDYIYASPSELPYFCSPLAEQM